MFIKHPMLSVLSLQSIVMLRQSIVLRKQHVSWESSPQCPSACCSPVPVAAIGAVPSICAFWDCSLPAGRSGTVACRRRTRTPVRTLASSLDSLCLALDSFAFQHGAAFPIPLEGKLVDRMDETV